MNYCAFSSDSKRQMSSPSSSHKLYSPQPVKMSSYTSDFNTSFGSLSPSFPSMPIAMNPISLSFESRNSSPCKKLFSSPEQQTQPFDFDEINRLRADSMNQLENEINRFGKSVEIEINADLLLQQLDEDFANFPTSSTFSSN